MELNFNIVEMSSKPNAEANSLDYAEAPLTFNSVETILVLDIRRQCVTSGVPFHFKQTGAHFVKDGRLYNIPRPLQMKQARRARINTKP